MIYPFTLFSILTGGSLEEASGDGDVGLLEESFGSCLWLGVELLSLGARCGVEVGVRSTSFWWGRRKI